MTLVANYDRAGTNRFCSHLLSEDETKTVCGIKCWDHKRDWQDTGDKDKYVGCLRCRRIVERSAQHSLHPTRGSRGAKSIIQIKKGCEDRARVTQTVGKTLSESR